jgi:HAD superfamily hydrolase (TIGR01509 family)
VKKTCLLFDNDGTLVDSEYLCNLGIAEQFAKLGVELDVAHLVRHYRGKKMSTVLSTLADMNQLTLPDDFLISYRQRVAELFELHLKPVPNIRQALTELPQTKAVVSNGPRAKIEHALQLCGLRHYFADNVYSAYDIHKYKPDPEIYLCVAKLMGVAAQECVVIEDSMTGVIAGSRAGISTLFYNTSNESHNLPYVTDFDDMAELPKLIAALD